MFFIIFSILKYNIIWLEDKFPLLPWNRKYKNDMGVTMGKNMLCMPFPIVMIFGLDRVYLIFWGKFFAKNSVRVNFSFSLSDSELYFSIIIDLTVNSFSMMFYCYPNLWMLSLD